MLYIQRCANFDNNAAFVVTDGDVIGTPHGGKRPHPLQPVVEGGLEAVGARVPHTDCACTGDRIGQVM